MILICAEPMEGNVGIRKSEIEREIVMRGGFTMVPNEIWEVKDLDWLGKVIWCYLYSMPESWNSSRNNVARNLGMCVKTVSTYIKKLEDLGMIKVHDGPRNSWDFEIIAASKWSSNLTEGKYLQRSEASSSEGATPSDLKAQHLHIKDSILLKTILKKTKKPKVEEEPVPEDLMDYYLTLKTVSLHLKFKQHLSKIKEVWPEYESFKLFLANRKEFYEKNNVITESFHKFRAVLSKAIKEEIGV